MPVSKDFCVSLISPVVTVAFLLMIHSSHAIPLIYRNILSYQKTSTTTDSPEPVHDHFNSSSTTGDAPSPSSKRPPTYQIVLGGAGAVILLVAFVIIILKKVPKLFSRQVCPEEKNLKEDIETTPALHTASG